MTRVESRLTLAFADSIAEARRMGAEALISGACVAAGGSRGGPVLREAIRHGAIRDAELTELRDQICWLLADSGYTDSEIGSFLSRSRSSVCGARARHAARMDADQVLAQRMAYIVGDSAEERSAA